MRAILLGLVALLPQTARADEVGPQGGPEPIPPTKPEGTGKPEEAPAPPPSPRSTHEGVVMVKKPIRPREIVVDIPGIRPRQTKLMLGGLAAGTMIAGGIALYFHKASRDAANDVSRSVFEGETWSQARQDRVDEGERSRTRAMVSYTVSGLFLTGTIVALILTEPKSERSVIRPRHAGVVPIPGGAIAGAGWSF